MRRECATHFGPDSCSGRSDPPLVRYEARFSLGCVQLSAFQRRGRRRLRASPFRDCIPPARLIVFPWRTRMPPLSVRIVKRTLDIAAASLGLSVTLPFYPILALLVKLDSEGPVFYTQVRARGLKQQSQGEEDKRPQCVEFRLVKFRTMRQNAEAGTGAVLAQKNDPRVTRLGRFMRKVRLDELPQLWNVLKGDMSLIGPRPERPELLVDLAMAIPYFEERIRDCKPGLTGLAQVSLGYTGAIPDGSELAKFRDSLQNPFKLEAAEGALADDLRAKLLYDLAYTASLERFSTYIRTELKVLFMTPMVLLRGSGQ